MAARVTDVRRSGAAGAADAPRSAGCGSARADARRASASCSSVGRLLRRRRARSGSRTSSPTSSGSASRWARSRVLMVQHLSGGAWGMVARRVLEAATRTLPLMALLFLPICVQAARRSTRGRVPRRPTDHAHSRRRRAYLNAPFFYVRAVALLRHLGRADLLPEQVVARAGRAAGAAARPARSPVPRAVGPRPRALRADDHVHERRLGDVARPALVLDDLRRPDARRPGPVDDGVHDHRAGARSCSSEPMSHGRRRRDSSTTSAS